MSRTLQVAAGALVLFTFACASGGSGPSTTPTQPPSPSPRPSPAAAVLARPYTSSSPTYQIVTIASVRSQEDSAAISDTLETRIIARLIIERGGSRLFISGSLDSFTVRGSGRLSARTSATAADTIRFRGEATTLGRVIVFTPEQPARCESPADALVAAARDLIVPLADPIAVGTTWTDTVTTVGCHGGIALTTVATRRYEVRGLTTYTGVQALEVARTSEMTVEGSGTQYGVGVRIAGDGTGTASLYLDPGGGGLLGSTGETTATLRFTSPRGVTTFTQIATQRVERKER
jgi:hypothetical protein